MMFNTDEYMKIIIDFMNGQELQVKELIALYTIENYNEKVGNEKAMVQKMRRKDYTT